jgi:hypothetical protein
MPIIYINLIINDLPIEPSTATRRYVMKKWVFFLIILVVGNIGIAQASIMEVATPELGYYNTGAPLPKNWPADIDMTLSQGFGQIPVFYNTGAPLPKNWPADIDMTLSQGFGQIPDFYNTGALLLKNWPAGAGMALSSGGLYQPQAPLAPTFILFGSGLLGLIGFKRFRTR